MSSTNTPGVSEFHENLQVNIHLQWMKINYIYEIIHGQILVSPWGWGCRV